MSKAKLLFDEANQKIQRLNLFTTRIFGNSEDLKEQIVDLLYRSFDQYNICKDYENSIACLEKIMKYAKNDDLSKYAQDAIKIYIKLKDFDKIESLIETYFPPDRITGQTIKILSTLIKEFIDIDEFNKAEKYVNHMYNPEDTTKDYIIIENRVQIAGYHSGEYNCAKRPSGAVISRNIIKMSNLNF